MLVLSRQRDESIVIGDNIVITIVDIRGDKVRLGIEAPNEVPVHRQEVFEAIQRENRKSASPAGGVTAKGAADGSNR
jgi:carbon storage regulator